jgi:site-specific recombinase XerD
MFCADKNIIDTSCQSTPLPLHHKLKFNDMEKLVKKYAKVATPLKNISPHKLRSTYGTNLYRETKDIHIVAEVLGHKDINTTKKHYAAISDDIRKSVAGKVKLK